MLKMSKKNLKELAKSVDAYHFTENVYYYENDINYLSRLQHSDHVTDKALDPLIDELLSLGVKYVSTEQIAFSCGMYGNTGQVHKCTAVDSAFNPIKVFFTYY